MGFSIINPSILGYPHFRKPPFEGYDCHPRHNLNSFQAIRSQTGNLYTGLKGNKIGGLKAEKRGVKHPKSWMEPRKPTRIWIRACKIGEFLDKKMGLKQQEFDQIFWKNKAANKGSSMHMCWGWRLKQPS